MSAAAAPFLAAFLALLFAIFCTSVTIATKTKIYH
jgi:hypothetical protein